MSAMSLSPRASKRAKIIPTTRPAGWDDLPSEAFLLIGCFLDALELSCLALVNKATFQVIQEEIATRSILGIRLQYLNQRGGPPNRFGRLQEVEYQPKAMDAFFQKELLAPQRIVLQHMFAHNRTHQDGPQFVLAGGSMLHFYQHYHNNTGQRVQETFGDLDVFVMESSDGPEASDRVVKSVLLQAGEEIDQHERNKRQNKTRDCDYEYGVYRHSGTFTMAVNNLRPLQIILRRISCIEELLFFFDLDCCRFAFDGTELLSTVEGLRSVALGRNFVEKEHVNNPMYARRAIKYGYRGFDTGFGRIHPLQHLLPMPINVFYKGEYVHSEEAKQGRSYFVDEGLYSSLGNATLSDLHEIAQWDSDQEQSEAELDDGADHHDERGNLMLKYRGNKRNLRSLLVDESAFAPSFELHFEMKKSPMFRHYYYESHLRRKYNIARCYITGRWFHCASEGEAHFSTEGKRINRLGYDVSLDLTGAIALVTGARVKIGFATCLELLRSGATVIGTSRFAADAEVRFRKEDDYEEFHDRLFLLPLNLLCVEDIQRVVQFVQRRFRKLHILINNAAQTVRLPLRCYTKLIQNEYGALSKSLIELESSANQTTNSDDNQLAVDSPTSLTVAQQTMRIKIPDGLAHLYAPPDSLATRFQGLTSLEELSEVDSLRLSSLQSMFKNPHPDDLKDFRRGKVPKNPMKACRTTINSWKLEPTNIHPIEMFETQTINHLAPTMLLNGLVPLMSSSNISQQSEGGSGYRGSSYVINVTSIEGQFSVPDGVKESVHVHTNASKAALNMVTRSGASFYASKGILVNSVDTGWVSSTVSTWKDPPLTTRDAALRILFPVLIQTSSSGKLYKNYQEISW